MLVVLDNARDSQQARPLLPGATGAMVVITSRSELTGLAVGEGAETIDLPLLGETESLRLLANHLGSDWVARHADSAGELVRLCDRLPLALSIIGARAAARPDSAATVLMEQLRDARGRLDVLTAGEASSDLRAVLGCSYGYLSAPAARLFRLLSIHPGPEVSAPAAASLAGAPSGVALEELIRAHLVIEQRPGRYALHDLLRVYASERARECDDTGKREAVVDRVLDHYLHTAHAAALLQEPPRDPLALPEPAAGVRTEPLTGDEHASAWFDTEHAVLMRCVALAARTNRTRHAWQLSWTLMTAFSRSGHWSDLATALSLALDAADRAGDLTGQAWAHRFLGRVRTLQGEYEAALGHLQDALELFGRLGDAAGQAAVQVGLIRECERRGQHQVALEHAKRALKLQQAAGYRVGETIALNNVGWCYVRLGQYTEAQSWCREALAAQQAIGYRPGEAYTWDTLGYAHHHLQQFDEATWCYRQALDLYRLLDDRYEQAATLARLGDTHAAAGDEKAARSRWRQALDLLDALHHPDGDRLRDKLHRVTARV
jgi:tetratricopeptide (TPR) repeat protein